MPADIAVILAELSHAVFINESTWGEVPGSPTRIHIPVTSCGVRHRPQKRAAQQRTGLMQRKHGRLIKGHPSGNIVVPLYGWHPTGASMSAAQYMLEWGAIDQETKFPRSKVLEWAVGPDTDNQRHLGLRVNSMTLAGSADSGISLTLETIGRSTVKFTTAATKPTDHNRLTEFLFEDLTFELDGTETPIGSFEWKITRALQPNYWDSATPQALPATSWTETLSITPPKTSATWNDLRLALGTVDTDAVLTLKGLHEGTGGSGDWTVCEITFPRLNMTDVDMQEANGIYMEPLTFDVLKPDTSSNGSTMAWSEE